MELCSLKRQTKKGRLTYFVLRATKIVYTDFPIESLDALKMFIRPSELRAGDADHTGDLVEFNRRSER